MLASCRHTVTHMRHTSPCTPPRAQAAPLRQSRRATVSKFKNDNQDIIEASSPVEDEAAAAAQFSHGYLIFNPAAGQENPAAILGDISLKLSERMKLTVLQTHPDVSPQDLAKQALQEGADVVMVSGGDGTVGAVAGALVDTGVPLGIIPRGTANAFSVALGIPTHLDDPINFATQAADVILQGHTVDVDTAEITTTTVKDYPMILLLGIGYEAETVAAADRDLKDALGPLAYVVSGARQLVSAQNFTARVTVDGQEADGQVAAITIANAAPPFSVLAHGHTGECIYDDGKLEAIGYVAAEGRVTAPLVNAVNMVRLFTGIMFSDQPVQHEERIFGGRYKDIRVECDPPQKVVLDGELLGETPVHARVKPASLKVIVPRPPVVPAEDTTGAEEAPTASSDTPAGADEQADEQADEDDTPETGLVSPLVEASAQVDDRPVVAPAPK